MKCTVLLIVLMLIGTSCTKLSLSSSERARAGFGSGDDIFIETTRCLSAVAPSDRACVKWRVNLTKCSYEVEARWGHLSHTYVGGGFAKVKNEAYHVRNEDIFNSNLSLDNFLRDGIRTRVAMLPQPTFPEADEKAVFPRCKRFEFTTSNDVPFDAQLTSTSYQLSGADLVPRSEFVEQYRAKGDLYDHVLFTRTRHGESDFVSRRTVEMEAPNDVWEKHVKETHYRLTHIYDFFLGREYLKSKTETYSASTPEGMEGYGGSLTERFDGLDEVDYSYTPSVGQQRKALTSANIGRDEYTISGPNVPEQTGYASALYDTADGNLRRDIGKYVVSVKQGTEEALVKGREFFKEVLEELPLWPSGSEMISGGAKGLVQGQASITLNLAGLNVKSPEFINASPQQQALTAAAYPLHVAFGVYMDSPPNFDEPFDLRRFHIERAFLSGGTGTPSAETLMRRRQYFVGDLNGDGEVDAADAATVMGHWGELRKADLSSEDIGESTLSVSGGDLNFDGVVDAADSALLFQYWTGNR